MKPEGDGWKIDSEHPETTIPYTLWYRLVPCPPSFAPNMQFHFDLNFDPLIEEVVNVPQKGNQ